jgi:ATP synthase protein I
MSPEDRLDDEFERRVRTQTSRMRRARGEEEGSIWSYLGLLGMVGWSIVTPTALGALLGWWIDSRWRTDDSWTLGLLVLGLAVGCFNAWRMITQERG